MRGAHLAELVADAAAGVTAALSLVDGVDGALVQGFARLDEQRAAALASFGGAFGGTPLAGRLADAIGKLAAGSIGDEHLAILAGGRTAVLGAAHDALLDRLDTALSRTREPSGSKPGSAGAAEGGNAITAARSWLRELAIAGWRGVDQELAAAAAAVVAATLAEPGLRRLAVLLDGLAAELRATSPVAAMPAIPVRRWADLWTRGVLLAQRTPAAAEAEPVSGRLLVLGVEVHEHGTAARLRVHGVLEAAGAPARLVRTGVVLSKVDTIVGPAVWQLCRDIPNLLGALAEHRALELTGLPLLPGGDLLWQDEAAQLGEPVDPFVTARIQLPGAAAVAIPPLDRHPVAIAEPVLVEGYQFDGDEGAFRFGDTALPVETARLPTAGPLTPEAVAGSSACIGLLGWDGGWSLRPLAIERTVKKKTTALHTGDWALGVRDAKAAKANAAGGDAVAVLRERAGRLLRR
jgi:hypothetical protein